jgi:hypothetical protein
MGASLKIPGTSWPHTITGEPRIGGHALRRRRGAARSIQCRTRLNKTGARPDRMDVEGRLRDGGIRSAARCATLTAVDYVL